MYQVTFTVNGAPEKLSFASWEYNHAKRAAHNAAELADGPVTIKEDGKVVYKFTPSDKHKTKTN